MEKDVSRRVGQIFIENLLTIMKLQLMEMVKISWTLLISKIL